MPFFYDPNHYASVLTISFVFAILAFAEASEWKRRIATLFLILLFATGLISTGSRTGVGVLIICIVLSLFFYLEIKANKRLRRLGILVILGVVVVVSAVLGNNISDLLDLGFLGRRKGAIAGLLNRLSLWTATLETWTEYPVFGGGPGIFIIEGADAGATSHNSYVGLLSQFGIVGFAVSIMIILLTLKQITRYCFDKMSWTSFCFLLILVSLLVWGVFLNIFVARRFWFVIGLVLSVSYRELDVEISK
jgi:O-antigen ligase